MFNSYKGIFCLIIFTFKFEFESCLISLIFETDTDELLNESNDGFYIASEDLKLRGPGDFFGIRQSGELQFKMADVLADGEILKNAKEAVGEFIASGNEFIDKKFNNDILIY